MLCAGLLSSCSFPHDFYVQTHYDLAASGPLVGSTSVAMLRRDNHHTRSVLVRNTSATESVELLLADAVIESEGHRRSVSCVALRDRNESPMRLPPGEQVVLSCSNVLPQVMRGAPEWEESKRFPTHSLELPWRSSARKGSLGLQLYSGEDREVPAAKWSYSEGWVEEVMRSGGGLHAYSKDAKEGAPVMLSSRCSVVSEARLVSDDEAHYLVFAIENGGRTNVEVHPEPLQSVLFSGATEKALVGVAQFEGAVSIAPSGRSIIAWRFERNEPFIEYDGLRVQVALGGDSERCEFPLEFSFANAKDKPLNPAFKSPLADLWSPSSMGLLAGPRRAFTGNLEEYTGHGSFWTLDMNAMLSPHHGFNFRWGARFGQGTPETALRWAGNSDESSSGMLLGFGYLLRPFKAAYLEPKLMLGFAWSPVYREDGESGGNLHSFDQQISIELPVNSSRSGLGHRETVLTIGLLHSLAWGSFGADEVSGSSYAALLGLAFRGWQPRE